MGEEWVKLLADDGTEEDYFGESVSISGDIAIIGASGGVNGIIPGSPYLFDVTTGVQQFKLTADDAGYYKRFGWSVAISGTAAIVGSPGHYQQGSDSGAAYIFDTTSGDQLFRLLASDGAVGDEFGCSVAISGTTAIVGARGNRRAYVFDTVTGDEIDWLIPDDNPFYSDFGYSVAISGTTAIVGAPLDDENGDFSGSACLFDTTTGAQLFKLLANDGAEYDQFGYSVAISGTTAIVGALGDSNYSGSAYLFDTATGHQIAKLLPSDAASFFGDSVAISGDVAIVGAKHTQTAYVFRFNGSTWMEEAKLLSSDGASGTWFESVAISSATATVGAIRYGYNGSAYIFHGLGDLDENGIIDICDIGFDGPVEIASIGEPTDVVSIDFTGTDGNDIAIAELGPVPSEPGYIVLLLNDGTGLNFTKMSTGVGLEPTAFAVGDFDGMNGPDVAVTNSSDDDVRILLNDGEGNGTFLPPNLDVPVGDFPSDIAAGDFDGDDDIDLAVTNKGEDDGSGNTVMILRNDGDGAFSEWLTFGVGTNPSAIAAGDFDGDLDIDLAVANEADNTVMIFLNDGARGFQHYATIPVDTGPGVLEPEDLDDDQHIDMAVGNRGSDKITLLINDGEANFQTMTLTVGQDPASIAIADVELDGDQDILVVADTLDSRAVRVLRNDLNQGEELSFTLFTDLAEDPNLKLTAAKDLDGNSLPDVIAVNGPAEGKGHTPGEREEGSVRVLLNGLQICPGDLDGDWDVDTADLLQLLGCWGTDCGDVDFDGDTDTADLLMLLGAWGECP